MKTLTIDPKRAFVLWVSLLLVAVSVHAQLLIPGNDVCADAYTINCGFSMTGNTSTAQSDMAGATCDVEADAPGIWFKAAPGTGEYAANVCAVTSFDSRILVFQGDCNDLVCVAGNEDWCGEASRVEWPAHPTDWSYIYVTGVGGQTGPIQLQLQCYDCGDQDLYPNDTCAGAIDVLDQEYQGSTCCAGVDDPDLCTTTFAVPYGVWFKANSGSFSDLNFTLTNLTGVDIALTIYEDQGGGCGDLLTMACAGPVTNVIAGNLDPIFGIEPNTDYYFFVNVQNVGNCGSYSFAVNGEGASTPGCTDAAACNYNASATADDGSCTYPGCLDASACNFNPTAGCAGSCTYPEFGLDCNGECLQDSDNDGVCDPFEVAGCTQPTACNYLPEATDNDGSCFFANAVFDCEGNCQVDLNNNGVCDQLESGACSGPDCCGNGTLWDPAQGICIAFDQCPADVNEDGVVDAVDILDLIGGYGSVCP